MYYPDERANLLANPPANLNAFITRIRDLEAIGGNLCGATPPAAAQVPTVATNLPAETADLASVLKSFGDQLNQSVRDMRSMVSVVRIDVVRKLLRKDNRVEEFIVGFDKTRVRVVGENELTVHFKCQVANLRRVKVVESSVYEMILGAKWIAKSNIVICAGEGRLVARVRTSVIDAALHAPQKEIEEQKY